MLNSSHVKGRLAKCGYELCIETRGYLRLGQMFYLRSFVCSECKERVFPFLKVFQEPMTFSVLIIWLPISFVKEEDLIAHYVQQPLLVESISVHCPRRPSRIHLYAFFG